MITLPQLKSLMKEYKLSCSCKNKHEIIATLLDKNIITTADLLQPTLNFPVKETKNKIRDIDPSKYAYLKGIRRNPKTVEVRDMKTNETTIYQSTYKVIKELGLNPYDKRKGGLWKRRYEIIIR